MLTMNVLGRRNRLGALGLAAGLVLGGASVAQAQTPIFLTDPNRLPDLAVSVAAPANMYAYGYEWLTIRVDNHLPLTGAFALGNATDVSLSVDLTGLVPVWIYTESGLSCTPWGQGDWHTVRCSGSIPWGSSATVYVAVHPQSSTFYCGRPTYSDASVSTQSAERSTANNRAIARTDLTNCIG